MMMKFRTEVKVREEHDFINHQSNILSIGSCFADNVGEKLTQQGFDIAVNPLGILFNPHSLLTNLIDSLKSEVNEKLIIERDQHLYHYSYHSEVTANKKQELLLEIKRRQKEVRERLLTGNRLILTFGTSWVYRLVQEDAIVANCHKIPQNNFQKELLDLEELKGEWATFFSSLNKQNPAMEVILTVSPVRHVKNGLHENNLSKSILLLLCDYLVKQFNFIRYFPSYELVIDDLRDYRFFNPDLIHPNDQAIEFVYEHFSKTYFSDQTIETVKLVEKLIKLEQHNFLSASEKEITLHNNKIRALKEKLLALKIKL